MFNKKLKLADLQELRERIKLTNQYVLVAQALEAQKNTWIKNILPKYGCDLNKNYAVELKTGKIKEAKKDVRKN